MIFTKEDAERLAADFKLRTGRPMLLHQSQYDDAVRAGMDASNLAVIGKIPLDPKPNAT